MNKYKIFILVVLAVVCGICFFIFNQIDNVNLMNTNQEKKKEIIGKINKKIEWYEAAYNKNNHLYQN